MRNKPPSERLGETNIVLDLHLLDRLARPRYFPYQIPEPRQDQPPSFRAGSLAGCLQLSTPTSNEGTSIISVASIARYQRTA